MKGMRIAKYNTTEFTASALGNTMALKLVESYAEQGWTVDIKTTTLKIVVEAWFEFEIEDEKGGGKDGTNFVL